MMSCIPLPRGDAKTLATRSRALDLAGGTSGITSSEATLLGVGAGARKRGGAG